MNIEAKPQASIPIIVADIYELAGRLRECGEAIAKTVGQTQARWQVMSAASAEPHSVPQIARVLGVTRQNVQRIADLLVAEGRGAVPGQSRPSRFAASRAHQARPRRTRSADEGGRRLSRPPRPQTVAADVVSLQRGLRRLLEALDGHRSPQLQANRSPIMNTETIADA